MLFFVVNIKKWEFLQMDNNVQHYSCVRNKIILWFIIISNKIVMYQYRLNQTKNTCEVLGTPFYIVV